MKLEGVRRGSIGIDIGRLYGAGASIAACGEQECQTDLPTYTH
jgi:hypothetical protein